MLQCREELARLRAARDDLEFVALHRAQERDPRQAAAVGRAGASGGVAELDDRVVVGDELDDPSRRPDVEPEPVADRQPDGLAVADRGRFCRGLVVLLAELCGLRRQRAARLRGDLGQLRAAARPRSSGNGALDERGRGQHHRPAGLEHLQRDLGAHQRAPEVHQDEHAVVGTDAFDGRADALGVGADRAVVDPAGRLDQHLAAAHLRGELGHTLGQPRAVGDENEVDRQSPLARWSISTGCTLCTPVAPWICQRQVSESHTTSSDWFSAT